MSCCGRAPPLGAADILRHCAAALPAFKTPKQIVLSDELPKTERGKLDRKALVERWSRSKRRMIARLPTSSTPWRAPG